MIQAPCWLPVGRDQGAGYSSSAQFDRNLDVRLIPLRLARDEGIPRRKAVRRLVVEEKLILDRHEDVVVARSSDGKIARSRTR